MLIKQAADIPSREITPRDHYARRREFIKTAALSAGAALAGVFGLDAPAESAIPGDKLTIARRLVTTSEALTPQQAVTSYCNFWEFGSDKDDPLTNAGMFKPKPWSVAVEGECAKPGTYTLEDILKPHPLEERVYRLRCVEGWSMVIPWVGFPLASLIKRCEPTSKAAFVEFTTLLDRRQMPGQESDVLQWPYVEGLRMDEAMHPLTILAVGLYGETLPNQNGAPLRLVVPWKYGFKGIKSIVKVRFLEKQPVSSWQIAWPQAYGFYANVNPAVPHPRHSQAVEARLPSLFQTTKTLPFNGYGDQVASLYAGLDLRRNY